MTKYPQVEVILPSGHDPLDNTMTLLSEISGQMEELNIQSKEIDDFFDEAMDGDYYHMIKVCFKWVKVKENERCSENNDSKSR